MASHLTIFFVLTMFAINMICLDASFSSKSNRNHSVSPGVLKLIVKAYTDELLSRELIEKEELRHRLEGLSDHVATHPALYQKHLFVGHGPPTPDADKKGNEDESHPMLMVRKRHDDQRTPNQPPSQFPSEEICTTISQWEQINATNDFNNNPVEVVQEEGLQQYVFTYRCAKTKGPCTGISPLYQSECTERFGWMYMYYKKEASDTAQWGYVEAPHHCACKIQPKIFLTTPAEERR